VRGSASGLALPYGRWLSNFVLPGDLAAWTSYEALAVALEREHKLARLACILHESTRGKAAAKLHNKRSKPSSSSSSSQLMGRSTHP